MNIQLHPEIEALKTQIEVLKTELNNVMNDSAKLLINPGRVIG